MSKQELESVLSREIEKLNERIDLKILEGEPYRRDARRHKLLLSQIKQMRRRQWFSRTFGMALF